MPTQHDDTNPAESEANGRIPTLHVQNLQFAYPDGHQALHGVSFAIAQGEKVALVGPNGAGKSTVMLHLNGLLGDENSPVQVAGMPMNKSNLAQIRAKVGLVFQNPDDQLFSPTVFDDVAFGPLHMGYPEDKVRQRVATALAQVGMADFEERLSHHLSVGQKKRVAIATVLSMSPEILVLDEPAAGLDPRGRRALINLMQELPLTMLVSSHDMLMVREVFDRMIVMDGGRIVADGRTRDLMADEAFLEAHGLELPWKYLTNEQ